MRWILLMVGVWVGVQGGAAVAERLPNVVLIVTDDMGYADMSCQGATRWKTPHLDEMATRGTRFTDFYVAQAVCTASRAAFLRACLQIQFSVLARRRDMFAIMLI